MGKNYLKTRRKLFRRKEKIGFKKAWEIKPPKKDFPTPIFLKHTPKTVGWWSLFTDEKGLKAEDFLIDMIIKKRSKQNRLNGMSVTGIAKKTECSICRNSYVECNHLTGDFYEENQCNNIVIKTDFVEASIVKKPINSECPVNLT